jgi:hypothetical protein
MRNEMGSFGSQFDLISYKPRTHMCAHAYTQSTHAVRQDEDHTESMPTVTDMVDATCFEGK